MSATSAVSSATSVPAAPIATPTRAAASAGASLTPSPTIATAPSSASSVSTRASFSSGSSDGVPLVDARLGRDRRARRASLSPVSITTRSMPRAAQRGDGARRPRVAARRRARTAPASRVSLAEHDDGLPARLQLRDASGGGAPSRSAARRGPPAHSARPSTRASTPRPGSARKPLRLGRRDPALVGRPHQRRARAGARSGARRSRRARSASSSSSPSTVRSSASCGVPCVSVPVLSSATTRIRAEVLQRLAALDRARRSRAAAPIAETTATGMEITSEHGQATISSASARYSQVEPSPPSSDRDRDERRAPRRSTSGV